MSLLARRSVLALWVGYFGILAKVTGESGQQMNFSCIFFPLNLEQLDFAILRI